MVCRTPLFCNVSAGSYSFAELKLHSHLQENHGWCYPYHEMQDSKGKAWATFTPDNLRQHVKGKIKFPYLQLAKEILALVHDRHSDNYPEVKKLKGFIDLAESIAK